jgi:hypothetical protein
MRVRTYFKHDDVCVLQDCFCAVEHAALSTFDINLIIFVLRTESRLCIYA